MDKTEEIIKEQISKLPKIVKDAISSANLGDKIKKIANKNMLHIDQAGILINETMFVMLGLEPIEDYKENIRRELNISRDRAQTITAEIDKEIFVSVREAMKRERNIEINLEARPLGESVVNKTEESEDIKRQIEKQNIQKPIAPLPPNLPIAPQVGVLSEENHSFTQVSSEGNDEEQNKPHIEKKKPYSDDPYREPIE